MCHCQANFVSQESFKSTWSEALNAVGSFVLQQSGGHTWEMSSTIGKQTIRQFVYLKVLLARTISGQTLVG